MDTEPFNFHLLHWHSLQINISSASVLLTRFQCEWQSFTFICKMFFLHQLYSRNVDFTLEIGNVLVALIIFRRFETLWLGRRWWAETCLLLEMMCMSISFFNVPFAFSVESKQFVHSPDIFFTPRSKKSIGRTDEKLNAAAHWPNHWREEVNKFQSYWREKMQHVITPIFRMQTSFLPYYSFTEVNSNPVFILITCESV